jgi:aryl-alcohol dehydrogenase-like predicted oxidoreductase
LSRAQGGNVNYRKLGRSGLEVSEVGLGTWSFASRSYGDVAKSDALCTIQAALDSGVTLFDTAPLYGDLESDGISERILGDGLGSERDRVVISTKFGRRATQRAAADFSAKGVTTSVEDSLNRLATDHIDVLFFHSPFGSAEIEDDVWGALAALKSSGKIRTIGHSISKFEDTEGMAREWSRDRKIDVIQVVYSLMNREAADLIHELGSQEIGIVARESLANGFLSGLVTNETVFPKNNLNARYSREEIVERVAYVEQLNCLLRGSVQSIPQASFRWVLDNPNTTTVLSGAKNVCELEDVANASGIEGFTADEHSHLNQIHTRDFSAA